jgi:hypothetical protein
LIEKQHSPFTPVLLLGSVPLDHGPEVALKIAVRLLGQRLQFR